MLLANGRNTQNPLCFPKASHVLRLWDSQTTIEQLNPSKGVFTWTVLDQRLSEAKAAGIPVIYTLGRTPSWAAMPKALNVPGASDATSNAPMDPGAFAVFIDALIAHAGPQIMYIEAWNEWNADVFWAGTLAELVVQQDILYSKAHAAGILVTTPTPCWSSTSKWPTTDLALDAFLALDAPFDIVTFHGYLQNGASAWNILPTLARIRQVLGSYGLNGKVPLWDTEYGPNAPANIAPYLQRQWVFDSLLARMQAGVDLSCWYQWDNQTHGTCQDLKGVVTTYGQAWIDFFNAQSGRMG